MHDIKFNLVSASSSSEEQFDSWHGAANKEPFNDINTINNEATGLRERLKPVHLSAENAEHKNLKTETHFI